MPDDFSADVKLFIDQNIESLAQLETLLLLRQDPDRGWTAGDVAKALYVPAEMAGVLLAEFARRGLAKNVSPEKATYSYAPADPAVDKLIGDVAAAYQDRRVAIITLIYSKPLNKVQTFADAFRIRKEPPP